MGIFSKTVRATLNGGAAPQSDGPGDPIVDWTTSGTARWMIDASGCLTIAPLEGKKSGELGYWRWFFEAPWHDNSSSIISVKIEGAIAILTATGMFEGCSSLKFLDLSSLDASSVTDMSRMFYGCSSLKFLDLPSLDAWRAEDMSRMFEGCSSLKFLDLSSLDASSVTDMSYMFCHCSSLESLDLSGLVASSAEGMSGMFSGCSSLTSLDLSSFDASKVTDMSGMFASCSKLESLDLPSLDASSATDVSWMFYDCSSLTSLDLSGLDTSSVTDMSLMFYGCSKLTSLDLSGLGASKVTNMWRMFYGCLSLRAVKLGESFAFANGTVLRLCSLPRPSGDGCTGLWLSSADGKAYAPKDVPSNVAATYTAQVSQAKVDISGALVSDIPDSVYTGAAIEPAFTVTLDGERLVEGADYMVFYGNNVYAGEATVTVHGIGGYSGEATRTFKILPAAMDRGMVSGVPAEMTATGSQLAPEPVVAFNGERLVEGRDYIVSYGDNVEPGAGAGSVTVSAVEDSNFTGSVTVYFDIEKKT